MRIIETVQQLQHQADEWRKDGLTIGLVPTMGFFHEGHLALMRKAAEVCDRVVTTLFVNPMQFGPSEDLDAYPRNFERDRSLAENVGVDVMFCPGVEEMYGANFQTRVTLEKISQGLCGASRPGHFAGVATVVAKLFLAAKPHAAVFGQKDFQQLALIRQMVRDLNFDIEIIGHPIVREEDGLAMSSRNKYLDNHERTIATCLYQAICQAQEMYRERGTGSSAREVEEMAVALIESNRECKVDYARVVDRDSLEQVSACSDTSMLMLAVKVNDKVRLIDNAPLASSGR